MNNIIRALFVALLVAGFSTAACSTEQPRRNADVPQSVVPQSAVPQNAVPPSADVPQDAVTRWHVSMETEKMTDKRFLNATATAHVSGAASPSYQLELRCDGSTDKRVSIATFSSTGEARSIEWSAYYGDGILQPVLYGIDNKQFHYRIDSEPAKLTVLRQDRYSNVGTMTTAILSDKEPTWESVNPGVSSINAPSSAISRMQSAPWIRTPMPNHMLVADIFPDETVEFSFAVLTPDDRAAIQKMCFSPTHVAAAASSVEAETANTRADVPQAIWKQVEGSSADRVRQLAGAPSLISTQSGVTTWSYDNTPSGTVRVYFVNGNDVASLDPPRK